MKKYPWWTDFQKKLADEVEEFVTGIRPALRTDRVLATVLFTDIVESTSLQASLGDTQPLLAPALAEPGRNVLASFRSVTGAETTERYLDTGGYFHDREKK